MISDRDGPAFLLVGAPGGLLLHTAGFGCERFDHPVEVVQPGGWLRRYEPGDEGYFEQVLGDLSWGLSVTRVGFAPDGADPTTLWPSDL